MLTFAGSNEQDTEDESDEDDEDSDNHVQCPYQ